VLATAGAGNPWISTLELAGAILTALLAIAVPVLCLGLLGLLCFFIIRKTGRLLFGRRKVSVR